MARHNAFGRFRWIGLVAAALLLVGCGPTSESGSQTADPGQARFHSQHYGLAFDYPGKLTVRHDFQSGYFPGERWNPDAPDDVPGDMLLALRLPASNEVTKGILRLGASDAPVARQHCTLSQSAVASLPRGESGQTRIDGVTFQRVTRSDAGMNHYRRMHSYRAVQDGHCIAIDIIVAGTNPQVYEPPRSAPFSSDAAFQRLTALLDGLRIAD